MSSRARCAALAAVLLVFAVAAFVPFRVDFPDHVANRVRALPGGGLEIGGIGSARTERSPAWLEELIRTRSFELQLRLRTTEPVQPDWVRIFTISAGHSARDFTVGQDGSDLVVHVRMPGTDRNGHPPLRVEDVFSREGPVAISVSADGRSLGVSVDGRPRASRELPPEAFAAWDPRYRVSVGNELDPDRARVRLFCERHGLPCTPLLDRLAADDEHAWRGIVDEATMRVGPQAVDYASPGALRIPPTIWQFGNDPNVNLVPWRGSLGDNALNLIGFLPFGFLLGLGGFEGRWRRRLLLVLAAAMTTSLGIEVVQLFLLGRTSSLTDVVMNTSGALLGAVLAKRCFRLV